jgi:PAS domain S-box-containing protein
MGTKIINAPKVRLGHLMYRMKNYLSSYLPLTSLEKGFRLQYYLGKFLKSIQGSEGILIDTDGTILSWNRDFQDITGYSEAEIIGQNISLFYHPEKRNLKMHEKFISDGLKKGTQTQKEKYLRKNGTGLYACVKIIAIKNEDLETIGFTQLMWKIRDADDD